MASKILNLLALSTLAILASSFGPSPVNAVSLSSPNHHARSLANHAFVAKKRAASGRPKCKPRPSSSAAPAPQPTGGAQSPPASQPSPAPPAPYTPPPASASGGKGMLAWGAGPNQGLLRALKIGNVGSYYNWGPYPVEGADAIGYEFVPMVWGAKDVDYVRNNIKPGQYKHILGFNEPDHGEQGNMDPGWAAQIWKEVMLPLRAGGTRLVSPAPANGPAGEAWMTSFLNACGGIDACGIDVIAVHVYATDLNYVKNYIQGMQKYNRPLWVTEFSCADFVGGPQPDDGQAAAFAGEMANFLKNAPYVERYAPFMVSTNGLGNVPAVNAINDNNGFTSKGYSYFG